MFNINKEPRVEPNVDNSAVTNTPGPNKAGELVDYIPPRTDIKAAGSVGEPKHPEQALGRKRR